MSERDDLIIEATLALIDKLGLSGLTRENIAEQAKVSPATVSNFGLTSISRTGRPAAGYRERILRAIAARGVATGDARMIRIGQVEGYL